MTAHAAQRPLRPVAATAAAVPDTRWAVAPTRPRVKLPHTHAHASAPHLLEAALEGRVLLDVLAVLGQGGGADASELAASQQRLRGWRGEGETREKGSKGGEGQGVTVCSGRKLAQGPERLKVGAGRGSTAREAGLLVQY